MEQSESYKKRKNAKKNKRKRLKRKVEAIELNKAKVNCNDESINVDSAFNSQEISSLTCQCCNCATATMYCSTCEINYCCNCCYLEHMKESLKFHLKTPVYKLGLNSSKLLAPKQHKGLRCKKCFELLCQDEDFKYHNKKLWLQKRVLDKSDWSGLVIKQNRVFCVNLHILGAMEHSTFANLSTVSYCLSVDKTTYKENFPQINDKAKS